MRICSFLPSATEIVCALGLERELAGVTHECDYPPEVRTKPVVVYSRIKPSSAPAENDHQVNDAVGRGESLYRLDVDKIREIQPDLIITQDLCHVCAASSDDVAAALAVLPSTGRVLSLSPHCLSDICDNIILIGEATSRQTQAAALVAALKKRIQAVKNAISQTQSRPRVLCLEWLEPPFIAGHWVPEMVEIAGGTDVLGRIGEPGFKAGWDEIFRSRPEAIVMMPCGYRMREASDELRRLNFPDLWRKLPAVMNGYVTAVDASSYFSRPGPRIVTGLEILAGIIHPEGASKSIPPDSVGRLRLCPPAA